MVGGTAPSKKEATIDFWYDVAGWGLLFGITIGIVALSRSAAQVTTFVK